MTIPSPVHHALVWGGLLSAILSAMLLAVLWVNPEVMLRDYPPDIQAKHGPMSHRTKRQKRFVSILFGLVVFGIVTASVAQVRANSNGDIAFMTAFVHLLVMFSVFNVVDLVLIDWPLVAFVPGRFVLPGTQGCAGYKDYWFHFRGFVIGCAGILIVSALLAGGIAAVL